MNRTSDWAVRVEGLRYFYDDLEAVRGVDLQVAKGELLAVLGTNGAGKTTVLEILQGTRRASAGTVQVLGTDPYKGRHHLAERTGVTFQDNAVPDELTPLELLETWRRLTDAPAGRLPADSLKAVGLSHRGTVRIGQLSGGERRRIELAVALSTRPELLFLDEPTAGLDPKSRSSSWRLIRELLQCGTTIVLTTHYLDEADALADRIAILHQGRVEVAGPYEEVVATLRSSIQCEIGDQHATPDGISGETTFTPLEEGTRLEVRTYELIEDLRALLDWSDRSCVPLRRLNASEASLEDVFHGVARKTEQGI